METNSDRLCDCELRRIVLVLSGFHSKSFLPYSGVRSMHTLYSLVGFVTRARLKIVTPDTSLKEKYSSTTVPGYWSTTVQVVLTYYGSRSNQLV
jgi:hypothetical protein